MSSRRFIRTSRRTQFVVVRITMAFSSSIVSGVDFQSPSLTLRNVGYYTMVVFSLNCTHSVFFLYPSLFLIHLLALFSIFLFRILNYMYSLFPLRNLLLFLFLHCFPIFLFLPSLSTVLVFSLSRVFLEEAHSLHVLPSPPRIKWIFWTGASPILPMLTGLRSADVKADGPSEIQSEYGTSPFCEIIVKRILLSIHISCVPMRASIICSLHEIQSYNKLLGQ